MGYHTMPVDATFVWPYKQALARDGTYVVHLETSNGQGTANATATASFVIGKHPMVTKCGGLGYLEDGSTPCFSEYQDENGRPVDPSSFASPAPAPLWIVMLLG